MAVGSIGPVHANELRALERTAAAFSVRVSRLVLMSRIGWPKLVLFETLLMEAGMPLAEAPEMVRRFAREARSLGTDAPLPS
jgi:hypothetical protein